MRKALKTLENIRFSYIATFDRYGVNVVSGREYQTLLLLDLKNIFGDYICDHVWIREIKKFKKLKLKKGDKVIFSAISKKYQRGYQGLNNINKDFKKSFDYRLLYIKNVKKIT